ncbi:tetratricopeptide repeat protein [Limnospira sp. PMC 917.15]|uniref:tetratricopeptide repeat protein n=1 Tax=Limnospira sp. PMC 917.15 TaxID=2981106 RepID=UPI0028E0D9E1|nr:tetratricopeptide repeat protein [Limnospira sp. PMC 917.15]MDT9234057.1 tetratricopeptide repeat protein [Limnospira sp. PMC 917.15]
MSAGELLRQANQLKRSGRLDEAIALYHQVIDINPHFAWAYHGLGDALAKQGSLDLAVTQYQKAIKINPNSAWFYINLGRVLIQQDCLEQAIHYLRQGIQIKPDLLYDFQGKYKPLFYTLKPGFYLSENEDFIELTEQPIWVTVPVQPLTSYSITGQSSSEQPPTHNQALIKVEFLDKNQKLIPSPYSAIPHSQTLGPYFYISTSGKNLSEFITNVFNTTPETYYLRLGFRTWHNKKPIILGSRLNLELDLLVASLEKLSPHRNGEPLSPVGVNSGDLKNVDEAIDLLDKVNHILPNCYGVYDTLGDIFLARGELSKAISAYRQCSFINSNYSFPYDKLRQLYNVDNLNGWAISEDLFLYIIETLPMGSTILELGSGTGTLELSKYYKMVSIEHNQDWLNKYNSHYIYAPLVDDMWYNGDVLGRKLRNIDYQLILVDGPPQHRRKGILNYLDLFNWNVPVIVDDINRQYDMDVAIALAKHLGKIPTVYKDNKYFAVIA